MKYNATGAALSVAVLVTLSACSSSGGSNTNLKSLDEIEARQAQLDERENLLKQREAALSSGSATAVTGEELLPPGAKAGQCFTRVWQEPQYRNVSDQKLISEASERIEIIPAKYSKVKKKVLLQEAANKLISVPATYKTVQERILVQPERTIIEEVPAVYASTTERVMDKPAHTVWKKGSGPIQRIDASTGEIMCLVEVPATYKTINKRVLKSPATTRSRTLPAEYKTITKRVIDKEAHTRSVTVPARYGVVTVTEQVTPASERRIPIAPKYTTVTQQQLVKDGEMQWREIMCETNTTPERITEVQSALLKAGFNPGSVDGDYGPSTVKAVNAFQRARGLPVDGYLNVETVDALGVKMK